ncbi:MAG: DUF3179 domain-containing protein [Candidatus Kapabacteria bacterium]|nr:DUF3179 domain-containing protein [Candidatus Kapabacteria bacterium]
MFIAWTLRLPCCVTCLMRWILFLCGLLLATAPPLSSVVLMMPIVPGAQELDAVPWAYFFHTWRWALYIVGIVCAAYGAYQCWRQGRWYGRTTMVVATLIATVIHVLVATKMSAEAMFNEPDTVVREQLRDGRLSDEGVMVVERNGVVAVYPIDLLAHHHKLIDTVGGQAVLITYCTMCHTGRVFSPIVDGRIETFRLVGANYYNAMFEDATTGSWWYQATGECVAGPRAGMVLADLPYEQIDLRDVPRRYEQAYQRGLVSIMRPDPSTGARADWSKGFSMKTGDQGDSLTMRTMVLGIATPQITIAYPVRELCSRQNADSVFTDTVQGRIVAITGNSCRGNGYRVSVDGRAVQHHADAWHAWKKFHPTTVLRRL